MSIEYSFRNKKVFNELKKYISIVEEFQEESNDIFSGYVLRANMDLIPKDLEDNIAKILNECTNKLRYAFKYEEIIIGKESGGYFKLEDGMSIEKIIALYNTGDYEIINEFHEVISVQDMIKIINKHK